MSKVQTVSLTNSLNPPQAEAVLQAEGPLLILAGAGSGKTRVLTHRVAHLIAERLASPDQILAVTFTNKAAREMESRIYQLLSDHQISVMEPLWISTFHSFGSRVLREFLPLLGYKPFFNIYDDSDQLAQIKKVITALNINDKLYPPKSIRNKINHAKMLALHPEEIHKNPSLRYDSKTVEIYARYEEEMKKANCLDFGDLLLKVYDLFLMYPDILEQFQDKFRYIMVDEYQDTNRIQYLLIKMMASKHQNLCVVGDEDQSIYSWRGADISNILDFEKDFPKSKVVKLEENYRSTNTIVSAASAVIKNNTERKDKTLFTNNPDGDLIELREERNEYDEARFVVKGIETMMSAGEASYNDFAVFYRTNAQSRVLEEQLRVRGIPYKLVGGVRFYERMEVKDILSFLRCSLNRADDISLRRIINVPARGIGKTTIDKIEELSIAKKITFWEAMELAVDQRLFHSGTTQKIRGFMSLMDDLATQSQNMNILDFYTHVLEKTEYVLKLQMENSVEADARIENLEELSNALSQFMRERTEPTLQNFLEEMALVSDVDSLNEQVNSVTMMTLHVSKGLEFPYVFVVGLEENLFPSTMGDEDMESAIEEERRLAYVGMTRARKKLFLSYAKTRKVWGQDQYNPPSRFIKEIPQQYVNFSTAVEVSTSVMGKWSRYASNPKPQYDEYSQTSYSYDDDIDGYQAAKKVVASKSLYNKGMKVRHPTFGVGSVFEIEGTGDDLKVSVLFMDQTIKKFVAKYARLERL